MEIGSRVQRQNEALTTRPTCQVRKKVSISDPMVLSGRAMLNGLININADKKMLGD